MTTMTVYDIKIINKDKTTTNDKSGPYYGSYVNMEAAIKQSLEYEKDPNVFMTRIESTNIMA